MKKLITAMLAALLLASCAPNPPAPTPTPTADVTPTPAPTPTPDDAPPAFTWTAENFPRLDGSTATIPLGQAVIAAFTGITREETERYTDFSGTTNAYYSLYDGRADLLIVYEAPPEVMEQYGDAFESVAIGRDALVFLLNTRNPVDDLTTEDLRGIYSGDVTSWGDLGGEDVPIKAFQRNQTSGSQTMMKKLLMGETPLAPAPAYMVIGEMGDLVDMIASFDNGRESIGYNVYYYVTKMKPDPSIKILSVDGIAPTPASIADATGTGYPLVNDFFAVIRKDAPANSPARLVYDWLTSADAKTLMTREGYVPTK
jgi:phosphate transport system substrate-binding protein